jgi:hypothetical protein
MIRLWDTVGLEEPENKTSGYMGAIEKATKLIRQLSASGRISFFSALHVREFGDNDDADQPLLILQVLGNKKVLIATRAGSHGGVVDMQRAKTALEHNRICASGHACITMSEGTPSMSNCSRSCTGSSRSKPSIQCHPRRSGSVDC